MAARINPIPVRIDDHEHEFLKLMSKKSHIPPATLCYIALREYIETHGYEDPESHDSTLANLGNR